MCRIAHRIYGNAPKRLLIAIATTFLLHAETTAFTQDCINFHQKYCISYKEQGYTPMPQSRSFHLTKGGFARQNVRLNDGQDYHVSFAVDDVFAQQLYVQIIDDDSGDVLYDNTEDNMNLNLEFSAVKEVNAKIYIETPSAVVQDTLHEISGCIGLLIETRPTPPTGFSE